MWRLGTSGRPSWVGMKVMLWTIRMMGSDVWGSHWSQSVWTTARCPRRRRSTSGPRSRATCCCSSQDFRGARPGRRCTRRRRTPRDPQLDVLTTGALELDRLGASGPIDRLVADRTDQVVDRGTRGLDVGVRGAGVARDAVVLPGRLHLQDSLLHGQVQPPIAGLRARWHVDVEGQGVAERNPIPTRLEDDRILVPIRLR